MRHNILLVIPLLMAGLLSHPAVASPSETKPSHDFEKTRACAEAGTMLCQYTLAQAYAFGDGVKKDFSQALLWLEKKPKEEQYENAITLIAAIKELKNIKREDFTGCPPRPHGAYDNGWCLDNDFLTELWQANKGDSGKQYDVGWLYNENKTGSTEAMQWLNKSAAQNNPQAIELLNEIKLTTEADKRRYTELGKNIVATVTLNSFIQNERKTFSTANHPKAQGVNLNISYPLNWIARETKHPNIVQALVSDGGDGWEDALIIVTDLPHLSSNPSSPNEKTQVLFNLLSEQVIAPDAIPVSEEMIRIKDTPVKVTEYKTSGYRDGKAIAMQTLSLIFFVNNKSVAIQFSATASEKSQLDARMTAMRPLFKKMAGTIVLSE